MKISANFNRHEFECECGCGFDSVDIELNKSLEDIRAYFSQKLRPVRVVITGGNRCHAHNETIEGAAENSKHIKGIAADFRLFYQGGDEQVPADLVAHYLDEKYPDKYGIGRYKDRTHLDVRETKARWDNR